VELEVKAKLPVGSASTTAAALQACGGPLSFDPGGVSGRPTMSEPERVGLLLGDPCGIGPELIARLLAVDGLDPEVATVVIGEPRVLARGADHAGVVLRLPEASGLDAVTTGPRHCCGAPPSTCLRHRSAG
jgi:hypothetical protein